MLVKNVKGMQSRRVPNNIDSWLDYYNNSFRSTSRVTCCKCHSPAEVGAHVVKMQGTKEWYLVPLCKECFEAEVDFEVDDKYMIKVFLM